MFQRFQYGCKDKQKYLHSDTKRREIIYFAEKKQHFLLGDAAYSN